MNTKPPPPQPDAADPTIARSGRADTQPDAPAAAPDQPHSPRGGGMAVAEGAAGKPPSPPITPGNRHPDADIGLPLPHERDESVGSVAAEPDPQIVQAKKDLDAGLVDTDMRATPGLDAERRKQLVKGSAR